MVSPSKIKRFASLDKSLISVSTSSRPLERINGVISTSAEHNRFCYLLNALVMSGRGVDML
jgi:hypothetical protein